MEVKSKYIIEMDDIVRIYRMGSRSVEALSHIDIKIPAGKLAILKGPSGSGKTTILNIMGGLDKPTSGHILLNGKDLSNYSDKELTGLRRKEIGFIFQSFGLIQSFTAFENVELPLRIDHVPWKTREDRTTEVLKMVGLGKRMDHRMFELSGGEQQRVGIARALASKPSLILADEPTGEVDYNTGMQIMNLFKDMVKERGVTICVATHDPAAMEFGDLVYEIQDGEIVKRSGVA